MNAQHKDQAAMLKKLGIQELNPMQEAAKEAITSHSDVVLLSPTGSGKTVAFLVPILEQLKTSTNGVQVLIILPSRELAIQIEQVVREMGSGFKANAIYGGRSGAKDIEDLAHPPAILIGTPGRIADHLRRNTFSPKTIKTLILDEFDKSLEVGFEEEMSEIIEALPAVEQKILTSATEKLEIPHFVGLNNPKRVAFQEEAAGTLTLKKVNFLQRDKEDTLGELLDHIGKGNGIVFCNFKDSIQAVSDFLRSKKIRHGCFHGGLEQQDRERELLKFRNGTYRLLVATDLAARGIDIPEMDFIIHYELSKKKDEFTHRNGRTARMNSSGVAYILSRADKELPDFMAGAELEELNPSQNFKNSNWATLYISGGRRDKISKGDIAGLFFKQGGLAPQELGVIELKKEVSFVAVPHSKTQKLIQKLNNTRLKKRKVRISLLS